jgi:MarR family 2-MHQ and catechol resistance regulon transcriptional repressor
MAPRGNIAAPAEPIVDRSSSDFDEESFRFLRCGHILGALLREILDESFLGRLCEHPLNRVQFCLLKLISVNANLQAGEVARYLRISPAAVTKNVDKLEDLGLLYRTACEKDRRATIIAATDEGLGVVSHYEDLKASRVLPALDNLDSKRLGEMCDLLEGVCVELRDRAESSRGFCLRCTGYYEPQCPLRESEGDCALNQFDEPTSGGREIAT